MARRSNQTILEFLDSSPPFLVYALSKKSTGKLRRSLLDLCAIHGLSERTVARICKRLTWHSIPVWQIDAFCRACGVNPLCMKRHREYLRETWQSKRPLAHLSDRQLKAFNLLSARWLALRERRQREAKS